MPQRRHLLQGLAATTALGLAAPVPAFGQSAPAGLVLVDGRITTMDPARPEATALAIVQEIHGKVGQAATGAEFRDGYEALNMSEERLEELGIGGTLKRFEGFLSRRGFPLEPDPKRVERFHRVVILSGCQSGRSRRCLGLKPLAGTIGGTVCAMQVT